MQDEPRDFRLGWIGYETIGFTPTDPVVLPGFVLKVEPDNGVPGGYYCEDVALHIQQEMLHVPVDSNIDGLAGEKTLGIIDPDIDVPADEYLAASHSGFEAPAWGQSMEGSPVQGMCGNRAA